MSWLSRFTQAWRTSMAEGDEAKADCQQTRLSVTLEGDCRGVVFGDGVTQVNTFGPDPGDWERGEDAPEPEWDPGDEVDDQGGMSEFDPRADEVARLEWERDSGEPDMGG